MIYATIIVAIIAKVLLAYSLLHVYGWTKYQEGFKEGYKKSREDAEKNWPF